MKQTLGKIDFHFWLSLSQVNGTSGILINGTLGISIIGFSPSNLLLAQIKCDLL